MARVYLSSTYVDLIELRKAALDAIRRAGHVPVSMEDYGAFEERPLDKCVADVRNCDAYVGVLGWRYGFVPPESPTPISITQHEYEAAGQAGIPRLMYLSPERARWPTEKQDPDPSRIEAFRNAVKLEHGVGSFDDVLDFKWKMGIDVSKRLVDRIGQGKFAINPLLPHTCDRTPQWNQLKRIMRNVRVAALDRPCCVVVHGDAKQALTDYLRVLRERHLPEMLGLDETAGAVRSYHLLWPNVTVADFRESLELALCQRVAPAANSLSDVADQLSQSRQAALIDVDLPVSRWAPDATYLLREFVQFWIDWPVALRCPMMLVVLWVEYKEPRPGGWWSRWFGRGKSPDPNEQIRGTLDRMSAQYQGDDRFCVLPPLENIPLEEVANWTRSEPEVETLCGRRDWQPDLGRIFGTHPDLPMKPLARELEQLLERYSLKEV